MSNIYIYIECNIPVLCELLNRLKCNLKVIGAVLCGLKWGFWSWNFNSVW